MITFFKKRINSFNFLLKRNFGSKKIIFVILHEKEDNETIALIKKSFLNLFAPIFLDDSNGRILKEMKLEDTPLSAGEKDAFLKCSVIYYYKNKPNQATTNYFILKEFLWK